MGGSPTDLDISRDGSFAIVSGILGCGWVSRLDFDLNDPSQFVHTRFDPGVPLESAWRVALSSGETEVAVTTWPAFCGQSKEPAILRLDANSSKLLGTIPIPLNSNSSALQNIYTLKYR